MNPLNFDSLTHLYCMLLVDKTVITDDLRDELFVCDVEKCKGACCVEGDLGAPLEESELSVMEHIYSKVKPYLSKKGIHAIEEQGVYIKDFEDDYSTPTIEGKECAYAVYNEKGILKCGIEQAYEEGKSDFRKPISCHLYPVRITKYDDYETINYDRWHICNDACTFGNELKIPLYEFLKNALIRKYGKTWYEELLEEVEASEIKKT